MHRWLVLALVAGLGCGTPDSTPAPKEAPLSPEELEARRVALKKTLKELVGDLEKTGRYDCCIQHPCELCAMRQGGCKCGESVRRGEPVCEECALMWAQGQGAEPGVEASSVRSYLEAGREHEGKACSCPDEAPP